MDSGVVEWEIAKLEPPVLRDIAGDCFRNLSYEYLTKAMGEAGPILVMGMLHVRYCSYSKPPTNLAL